jgi:CubicO group peptidase (beta-lactamase class C family)
MKRKRLMLLVFLVLVPVRADAQRVPRGLEDYIERVRKEWNIAGLAVAIVKNDSVVFAKGFGVREIGKPLAVDAHTLFAIGSNTKAFTAAAVGLMVDAGKMRWDDAAAKHLPGFQLFDPYASRELTLRDLLSHRSGLPRGDQGWFATPFSRQDILQRVRHLEPSWSFRSQYGYQNIMFLAAGEAVANASATSWDDLIKERFFKPLGMRTSNTSVKDLKHAKNVAMPHAKVNGQPIAIAWRDIDNVAPAGSINSNVAEMAQWLRVLLNKGDYQGQRLLSERVIREMLTPHTITGSGMDTIFPMSHFTVYGLGLGMRDYYGRKLVSHGGGIDGMLSTVAFLPEENLGVVVLTNTEGHTANPALAYYVIDRFINAPLRDWSAIFVRLDQRTRQRADSVEASLVQSRVAATQPSLPLEKYAGTYEHKVFGEVHVIHENGRLRFDRYGNFSGRMEHWHYDTFRITFDQARSGKQLATFVKNARGEIEAVKLESFGDFTRVPTRSPTATQ